MFSLCDRLNYRMYKVKENLIPFHKTEIVIPVASFFLTHSWGPSLQCPSAFLLLSAPAAISAIRTQRLGGQAQSVIAHSTHLLTLIPRPSCSGATVQAPRRQVGWGELVLSWGVWGSGSTPGRAADCPGSQPCWGPWQCPLRRGSPPGRSVPEASGLKGCKGDRESKRSKSREQALTADGFCPLLTASCNRPELLPPAGAALPSRVRVAVQMLSQPLAASPQPLAAYRQGG